MKQTWQDYDVTYSLIDWGDGTIMVDTATVTVHAPSDIYASVRARGIVGKNNPNRYKMIIHEVIAVPDYE